MSTSVFNRRWAALLLEALTRHGVRHICIAPGSRSTPLTLAAAAHLRTIAHQTGVNDFSIHSGTKRAMHSAS